LRIVDYSHGLTGSAHDATAFEHTTAGKHPDWFFAGDEFAWADSAYPVGPRLIPVHKKPASLDPLNSFFDRVVAHLRVRSEHCMGALKGRFQCLRGLRIHIDSNAAHREACRWITVAIILHNLIIDVEGNETVGHFGHTHTHLEEQEDIGQFNEREEPVQEEGENNEKRYRLVLELAAAQEL
jgi:hypothetical protein